MKWVLAGLVASAWWLGTLPARAAAPVNWAAPAQAQSQPAHSAEEPPPDDKPRPKQGWQGTPHGPSDVVSVTFSPLYLLLPMAKLTAEVRPVRHAGIAVFGGVGRMSLDVMNSDGSKGTFDASTYLVGGQLIGYPMRPFDGFQVGAQVEYVHVDVSGQGSDASVAGVGNGTAIGPFIGYKWITRVGFTAAVQAGFQYLAVQANASDQTGNSASDSDARVAPLLNLDVGWSF